MILELILKPFFLLIRLIVSLFPTLPSQQIYDLSGLVKALSIGISLLPSHFFPIFVSQVIFFKTASMAWALVEWVYKKIPGVD